MKIKRTECNGQVSAGGELRHDDRAARGDGESSEPQHGRRLRARNHQRVEGDGRRDGREEHDDGVATPPRDTRGHEEGGRQRRRRRADGVRHRGANEPREAVACAMGAAAAAQHAPAAAE